MRRIQWMAIVLLCSFGAAHAQTDSAKTFEYYIQAHWPGAELRADQRQWLARQSAASMSACEQGGEMPSRCFDLVAEGLREVIGQEPTVPVALYSD